MKTLETINYNNKLSGNVFIHIAEAPAKGILESNMPIPVLVKEIISAAPSGVVYSALEALANSPAVIQAVNDPITFEAEIIDIARITIFDLSSVVTYLSHGLNKEDFIKQIRSGALAEKPLAIYIFKKK
jgi:hypothetical protein